MGEEKNGYLGIQGEKEHFRQSGKHQKENMFVCRKNTYKKKSSDFSANSTIQLYGSRNSTREELDCWKDLVIKDREGRENQSSVEPTLIPWLSRQFPSPTWDCSSGAPHFSPEARAKSVNLAEALGSSSISPAYQLPPWEATTSLGLKGYGLGWSAA